MNLMEVLMVTNNHPQLAANYDVENVGLVVDVVNNVEEAITKLQNVNYEILVYDLSLEIEDAQKLIAIAQHQRPNTFRFQLNTADPTATIDTIKQTARKIVQAQEPRIKLFDLAPGCPLNENK